MAGLWCDSESVKRGINPVEIAYIEIKERRPRRRKINPETKVSPCHLSSRGCGRIDQILAVLLQTSEVTETSEVFIFPSGCGRVSRFDKLSARLRQGFDRLNHLLSARLWEGWMGLGLNPKLAAYYPLIFFCGKWAFGQIFELTRVQSEGVLNLFNKTC